MLRTFLPGLIFLYLGFSYQMKTVLLNKLIAIATFIIRTTTTLKK